ncbi:hypothetical protein F3Y22_tig00110551pilonHSYRG00209 [Hibiscus syriacus]|uniref:Uncharacterized protein n=1 Tax=Hibiscus syriacus TaxID=106335 RepID=A0A6A3ADJ1_HIBSY|nr:hypothetical protein F3Y22_tig00110551pilonHSYRG00209 [Hibiscus syriacus]
MWLICPRAEFDSFAVELSRSIGHDILIRELEIVSGSFVVKLSFELKNPEHDILRREVETRLKALENDSFIMKLGQSLMYDILCCEVEIVGGSFVVKLSFELKNPEHDILRREVETGLKAFESHFWIVF